MRERPLRNNLLAEGFSRQPPSRRRQVALILTVVMAVALILPGRSVLADPLIPPGPARTGPWPAEPMLPSIPIDGTTFAETPASPGVALREPATPIAGRPAGAAVAAPTLDATFAGVDFDTNGAYTGGFRFIPPDPHMAASPTHLVSVVNVLIEWRPKIGATGTVQALQTFFASLTPANFLFDPKVIYDQYAGRFVVVALERVDSVTTQTSRILVAVSQTSDPTAGWWFTAIDSKIAMGGLSRWADYPGLAVDDKAIYITANMFAFVAGGSGGGGVRLWIINKTPFYTGGGASVTVHDPYAGAGTATTTQPAHMFGVPPGTTGTLLVSYSGLTAGVVEFVQIVRVDDPLTTPTFTQQYVSLGDIDNTAIVTLPDAPQLGSASLIEVNDRRALNAVWRDNALWATFEILAGAGADSGQVTAHWVKLDTTDLGAISVADQGNVGGEDIAAGTTTFYPSVAVDSEGAMAIGFSASAATIYAGAYYTGRLAGDPASTVRASGTLKAGSDFYLRTFGGLRNRWGDYSGMALDPSDGTTFWVFNEYAMARGTVISGEDGRWATQYGSFHFNCLAPAGVSGLAIARLDAAQVQLTWNAVAGADHYEVWRATNAPYFVPGANCAAPGIYGCATAPGTSYTHAGLGDPLNDYTYTARAVSACGATSAAPYPRVGEFDFALVPGLP